MPQNAADESAAATRIKPRGTSGGQLGSLPAAAPDATRPRPREPQSSAPPESVPGTGSNWEHPEHWQRHHDATLAPGSVIKERFLLESVLGQGGMGVVYRALDRRKEEAQDRDPYVAVKVLSEEFRRHPNALIALQRERQVRV
jgi:non-specific serine/threonine protein kinase